MKRFLVLCFMLYSSLVLAVPMELNIPSENIKLSIDGTIILDNSSTVVIEFQNTQEKVTFTPDSYKSLRKIMDTIYKTNDTNVPVENATIYISVPTSSVNSINDLIN